jgi:hypothetical protein
LPASAGWSVGWLLVGQPPVDDLVQRVRIDAGQHAAHGGLAGWLVDPAQRVAASPERGRDRPRRVPAHSPIAARDLAPASTATTATASTAVSGCRRPRRCLGSAIWVRSSSRLRHWWGASVAGAVSRWAAAGTGDEEHAVTAVRRVMGFDPHDRREPYPFRLQPYPLTRPSPTGQARTMPRPWEQPHPPRRLRARPASTSASGLR